MNINKEVLIAFGVGAVVGFAIDRIFLYIADQMVDETPNAMPESDISESLTEEKSSDESNAEPVYENGWPRPQVEDDYRIQLEAGRDPYEILEMAQTPGYPDCRFDLLEPYLYPHIPEESPEDSDENVDPPSIMDLLNTIEDDALPDDGRFPDFEHTANSDLMEFVKGIQDISKLGCDDSETRRIMNIEQHQQHKDQCWWTSKEDIDALDEDIPFIHATYLMADDDWVFDDDYKFDHFSLELPMPTTQSTQIVLHNIEKDPLHQLSTDGTNTWTPYLYMHSDRLGANFEIETFIGDFASWYTSQLEE